MAPMRVADRTNPSLILAQKNPLNGLRNRWDPYKILDIYPNDPHFSCIGIAAYSQSRCRWRFFNPSIGRAACAQLDSIALRHPSDVTRESLEVLALSILCDNHERQMYTVIAEWNQKIARYVSEQAKHEEEQQQPSSSLTLDLQEAMDNVRKEMEKIKVERDGYQTQCANLLERNLRLAEAASARLMLEVSDRAKAETIQKLEREVEGRKKDVEEQKKLRSMNLAELQALRPFENSDRTKTEIIQRLEKELQGSNKGIEDQKKVHAEQVAELRALEQQVGDQKSLIDNLEAESQRDRLMREKSEREKSETIQKLEQKVQGKERDLEEQKRLHSEDLTKLDTLRQQKHESDSLLQNLHTEREDDERKIKDLVDRHRINETENKKRASGLERQNQGLRQQNQRFIRQNESLKQQKYLAAFRNALQLLIARKRCERAEQGNHVLVDEKANLIQRVETAEGKLAAADGILSSLKLQNAKKGVCAVLSTRPWRISVKKLSKSGA